MRVEVQPALLRWACARGGKDWGDLARRFPRLDAWAEGRVQPTLKQVEAFAKATHTPVGFLFLDRPPEEALSIPDLRTVGNRGLTRPSANLLDTLYLCEQRQDWYRDHARMVGLGAVPFVGSLTADTPAPDAARAIREDLDLSVEAQCSAADWGSLFRLLVRKADRAGVLVMVNGVVGVNTHRRLDPEEFRGFALADPLAPLVFINGSDAKAAQLFTLGHELAHLWVGESALSDGPVRGPSGHAIERWCNAVAAELLIPGDALQAAVKDVDPVRAAPDLARQFRVSTLAMLIRLRDAGHMSAEAMEAAYRREIARSNQRQAASGGGDFYRTQRARIGARFARAVIESTWEGRSTFTEAHRLLNVKRTDTMLRLAATVGLEVV